jgi:hypothetical protein
MTGPQASFLRTLAQEACVFDRSMTQAAASKEIDRLQETTGRGSPTSHRPTSDDIERLDGGAPGRSPFEGGDGQRTLRARLTLPSSRGHRWQTS